MSLTDYHVLPERSARTAALRAQLVDCLCEAAELEHSLCLQYMYTAFSLKNRPEDGGVDQVQIETIREWKGQLLLLSREEMLHLGLVLNLLAAVGAAPYLQRPNFPQPERYYPLGVASALEPLTPATLERYLVYELPTALLSEIHRVPQPADGGGERLTVGLLYERIRGLFTELDEEELFIGAAQRQIDTASVVDPDGVFEGDVATGYGAEPFPITDRASAMRAIDLIIEQGEGAPENSEGSHYGRLLRIREQLAAEIAAAEAVGLAFEPSRAALTNPAVRRPSDAAGVGLITDPLAREAAEAFNAGYSLMVLMLLRFFGRTDDSAGEMGRLQEVVFFPLMTMFIRPLGELLTELPAGADGAGPRAGAPFEFSRGLQLIPERTIAHRVFGERLFDLAARCRRLADRIGRSPATAPAVRKRIAFIAENVELMAGRFAEQLATDTPTTVQPNGAGSHGNA
ncbi:hypothetical protein P3T36_006614 [Kitasatospora sp. MAP12-15]|uniref:ferritin-like domain-containing protein n=1 Tax=unclassified Kitasatospora TaxID=2633591 RepID=UPI00247498D4|nr:ferritin-like domain-containing protein [Kitasatospora sp. MAP12-44]MDH6115444.1 hypothetical protein [Kitasatospora sp. MAP12-44]